MRFASSHHSRPRHVCSLPPNESGQLRYFGSLVSWKASNRSEQACCLKDSGRLPCLVHGVHELAMQGPISSRRNSASHTLRNFKLHVRGMPRHPHQSTCASISALLHIPSLFKRTRFFVVITASQRGGSRLHATPLRSSRHAFRDGVLRSKSAAKDLNALSMFLLLQVLEREKKEPNTKQRMNEKDTYGVRLRHRK